jgi:hypothetical protein
VTEPAGQAAAADTRRESPSGRSAGRILVSCLLALVAAFFLAIGVAGIVADVTRNPARPDAAGLVIIFLIASLAGWGGVAVWKATGGRRDLAAAGSGRPDRAGRSVARTVFSLLLWVVTAGLVLIGVAGAVSTVLGKGGSGASGLIYVFLIAFFTGSGALTVAKGGRRVATAATGPPVPAYRPGAPVLLDDQPPADPQARYRERCSQFPVIGGPVGICLLAGGVAGRVVAGQAGAASGIFLTVAVLSAIYVIFILIDLPNGIEISGGQFAAGVRGVPPAGRLWRRISGPQDAVRSWDVHTPEQAGSLPPQQRRGKSQAARRVQLLGDLRMFSRRQYLRLEVDPASVQARLPARILRGYVFVAAARAGTVWDGSILIGTRRPAALTAALEQALPGRGPRRS